MKKNLSQLFSSKFLLVGLILVLGSAVTSQVLQTSLFFKAQVPTHIAAIQEQRSVPAKSNVQMQTVAKIDLPPTQAVSQQSTLEQIPTGPDPTPVPTDPIQTVAKAIMPVDCTITQNDQPKYSGRFLALKKKGGTLAPGETFQVQVFIENTGNVPWFSGQSGCGQPGVFLGTEKDRDRSSPFATFLDLWDSNWIAPNRIKMDTKRVEPLHVASFIFWAKAPAEPGLYREYYAPVVDGVTWIGGEGLFSIDLRVGDFEMNHMNEQYLPYIQKSANLTKLDLSGMKNLDVSLSDQKMLVKIGDIVIQTFPVSTGVPSTHPTPQGSYKILSKQDVRVAGSSPHYIMPRFQMFKEGGFGLHALPSLANDNGVFWQEALDHIGEPRSHGCIRLLPDDADFIYNFTDVGTPMTVHR